MSEITNFFKQNKKLKANTTYTATKSLTDESGVPLLWEIKPITTKENDKLQESCMIDIPGKNFRQKMNTTEYIRKLIVASVVFPDLLDADLQDSYGVNKAEDLVQEIVDDSGEWNAFVQFINDFNNFVQIQDKIDEAKN